VARVGECESEREDRHRERAAPEREHRDRLISPERCCECCAERPAARLAIERRAGRFRERARDIDDMHRSTVDAWHAGPRDAAFDLAQLALLTAVAAGRAMRMIGEREPARVGRSCDELAEDRVGAPRGDRVPR